MVGIVVQYGNEYYQYTGGAEDWYGEEWWPEEVAAANYEWEQAQSDFGELLQVFNSSGRHQSAKSIHQNAYVESRISGTSATTPSATVFSLVYRWLPRDF